MEGLRMLEINNLEKTTPNKMLMASVNITLHEGEIFALVGEHDSGKSLLSKIILTLVTKTRGKIKIGANKFLGAFIPNERLMPRDTVLAVIKDYCRINDKTLNMKKAKNILAVLNLRNNLHTRIYRLSTSQVDRLKLALPLIVNADILILDAPFTNLNPKEAKDLRVLLKKISLELKTSIIVTARHMSEIEEFCDTIGIIDNGMIIAIKSYNEMIAKEFAQAKLALTVAQPNYAAQIIENELKLPTKLCGDQVIINTRPENVQSVVDKLVEKNVTVLAANRAYRSLEFQYLQIINNRKNFY